MTQTTTKNFINNFFWVNREQRTLGIKETKKKKLISQMK